MRADLTGGPTLPVLTMSSSVISVAHAHVSVNP